MKELPKEITFEIADRDTLHLPYWQKNRLIESYKRTRAKLISMGYTVHEWYDHTKFAQCFKCVQDPQLTNHDNKPRPIKTVIPEG